MSTFDPHHADRRTALAPDLSTLDARAARAWTERMAVRKREDDRYAVDSQSGATYVVDLTTGDCSCPDHRIRHEQCKHLRRVAIEVTAGRVPAPGRRHVACAVCGRTASVAVDADPPLCCGECRLEPGDRVVDAETGDTLVVYRVTDRRADEVRIEAADCTVADYPTNDGYPADDFVVEVVYPGDATRAETQGCDATRAETQGCDATRRRTRRYAFPRSRLADPEQDHETTDSRSRVSPAL